MSMHDFLNSVSSCNLCPRACGANRSAGKVGVCGAGDALVVARAALHTWEEPCICFGAGSGTIFFAHCPLRCVYCQNKAIAHDGQGRAVSVEDLATHMLDLQQQGACNINLVTGTHYVPWIIAALEAARTEGLSLPIVWNTSGYETVETVQMLAPYVDVWLADFKYAPADISNAAMRYSHASDYFQVATAAIDEMLARTGDVRFEQDELKQGVLARGVLLRHLLLPGRLEDSQYVLQYVWQRYGTCVAYSIMNQYTPVGEYADFPELNGRATAQDYEALLDFADGLGLQDYFWQDGNPASESFIPIWDR